jgi:hypothetical protein
VKEASEKRTVVMVFFFKIATRYDRPALVVVVCVVGWGGGGGVKPKASERARCPVLE